MVNCIEQHPTLPLVATSGIDNTVKLFAPDRPDHAYAKVIRDDGEVTEEWKTASRLRDMERIVAANADPQKRLRAAQRMRLEDIAYTLGVPRERLGTDCIIMVGSRSSCFSSRLLNLRIPVNHLHHLCIHSYSVILPYSCSPSHASCAVFFCHIWYRDIRS